MSRILVFALLLAVPLGYSYGYAPYGETQQAPPPNAQDQHSQTPAPAQSTGEANSRIQRSVEDLLRGDPVARTSRSMWMTMTSL